MGNDWYIRPYKKTDEDELFVMMEKEAEWNEYCRGE